MAKAKKSNASVGAKPATVSPVSMDHAAAEAAASLVASKKSMKPSTMFEQIKKQAGGAGSPVIPHLGGQEVGKKAPQGFVAKQVGHNQTFGADVNRKNIPRRSNG